MSDEERDLDLKALLKQQMELMKLLTTQFSSSAPSTVAPTSFENAASSITEFIYDPHGHVTFETWFKRYEDLFNVEFAVRNDDWKVRLLLHRLGPLEHNKYANYILPSQPRDYDFEETIDILTKIFGEKSSEFNLRYQCLNLAKREGDDFVTHTGIVNQMCERFKLKSLSEDQFRCLIFICSLQSPKDAELRLRLLNKVEQNPTSTLQDLQTECQHLLNLRHDTAMIQAASQASVQAIARPYKNPSSSMPQKKPPSACRYCGAWHFHRDCPYRNHRCQRCGRTGHKESHCKHSIRPFTNPKAKTEKKSLGLLATFQVSAPEKRQYVSLQIDGQPVRLQLDTASDITIISQKLWHRLGRPPLISSTQTATSACGGALHLIGEMHCAMSFQDITVEGLCYVSTSRLDLLGLDWIEKLGLLDCSIRTICNGIQSATASNLTQDVVHRFSDIFQDGLGVCHLSQVTLHLQPNSQPVFRPKRPVPHAALHLVDAELQRLQEEGVLAPVSYSRWAAPIVVVKKSNGSIRVCADFSTGLNACLQSNGYPLPAPEDLFTMLNGGKCFAKLDLAEAYLQIELAPESRELVTINTHRGLFQFTRLPFGVKVAPAVFQQLIDTILSGIPGAAAYLDDIVIVGADQEELRERIFEVLQRISDAGLRLRPEKCEFFSKSIKYLGFIFDAAGRHPDPENIKAIRQMPAPKDIAELRSFLGLISYYSAFLPSLHNMRAPLNHLLKNNIEWNWSNNCQAAFDKLKTMLSSDLLLTHYNPQLPIVVAADASAYGVGAVLLHIFPDGSEKAVMHASRTLTSAEKNYGQIEKEALALIFAVKRFHKLIYGRHFVLLTDHKPLLSVFGSKKGLPVHSANRLQRWGTILLGYDFEIQYRRTSDFGQADALSRLIFTHPRHDEDAVIAAASFEDDSLRELRDAVRSLPVTASDIRQAMQEDPLLCQVIGYVRDGWPSDSFTGDILQLNLRREALSVIDGCLMFGERVVVPSKLRRAVLRQFHASHPGINRMKSIARSYAYWPKMDEHIEDLVRNCFRCQQAAKFPSRESPVPWPPSTSPWSRVHIDFAGPVNGISYLVLIDAYSKWPEIVPISPTATATVETLGRLFCQHGLPSTIVSDNGTQFTSAVFADFCQRHAIEHIRSPPYHPQSNGQAERFVDTFKRALLKSRGEGTTAEAINGFLLLYRTTPNKALAQNQSPAEVLMGRKLRTTFSAMIPRKAEPEAVQHPRLKIPLQLGTKVYARDYRAKEENWTAGKIVKRRGKVIYDVAVDNEVWVRHRNQLRPRHNDDSTDGNSAQLPLDILLETFDIPNDGAKPATNSPVKCQVQPRRCTNRARKPTVQLQVNPRLKRY